MSVQCLMLKKSVKKMMKVLSVKCLEIPDRPDDAQQAAAQSV